jgi:hypothetical protein
VVAVEQDISKMCITLQWLPEDLDIIFVLQSGRSKDYEVVDKKIVFVDKWCGMPLG